MLSRSRATVRRVAGVCERQSCIRLKWSSALIDPQHALNQPDSTIFLDATWFMPNHPDGLRGKDAYMQVHVKGARHFDIDAISRPSKFPHMMPSTIQDFWSLVHKQVHPSISPEATIVVYDHQGMFAAARVWFSLISNGASGDRVKILDGGLPAWQAIGGPTASGSEEVQTSNADSRDRLTDRQAQSAAASAAGSSNDKKDPLSALDGQPRGLWQAKQMAEWSDESIKINASSTGKLDDKPSNGRPSQLQTRPVVLDARSAGRFSGNQPEPRPGIVSGHIPGSFSLPFDQLLRAPTKSAGQRLLGPALLRERFAGAAGGALKDILSKGDATRHEAASEIAPRDVSSVKSFWKGTHESPSVVTTCGSGVTASVLALALHECGVVSVNVYDGSWSEWGSLFSEGTRQDDRAGEASGALRGVRSRVHDSVSPNRVSIERESWDDNA